MAPCLSTVMFSGRVCVTRLVALGSVSGTCWRMTRMVMMKMISSTNITSTSGVTLMSDIATPSSSPPDTCSAMKDYSLTGERSSGRLADRGRRLVHPQAHLDSRNQVGMQLMCEVADAFLHSLVAAQENVVAQHCRNRDHQPDGGHDQCLTNGAGHLFNGTLSRDADGDQCVVDADHGAEQADEGRGGADRGEHRQTGLHSADDGIGRALQRLGHPFAGADGARETRLIGLVVFVGLLAGFRQCAKRIGAALQLT